MQVDKGSVYVPHILAMLEKKLVKLVPHPSYPLSILDYTPEAQFSRAWDEYPELREYRGMVVETPPDWRFLQEIQIVGRCMKKFFNLGERPDTSLEALSMLDAQRMYSNWEISTKLDGSCCFFYYYPTKDIWLFSTRGSFESSQSKDAYRIFLTHPDFKYAREHVELLDQSLTYVFELCAPYNRIVVAYPEEKLVLTGVVKANGYEYSYNYVGGIAKELRIPSVSFDYKCYDQDKRFSQYSLRADIESLLAKNITNEEGYVLFNPARQCRIKIKFEDYVKLHRIVSGLNEKVIWEYAQKDVVSFEAFISQLPDELHSWATEVYTELYKRFMILKDGYIATATLLISKGFPDAASTREGRKEAALHILESSPEVRPALFAWLDRKPSEALLWKYIEPTVGSMGRNIIASREDT